MWFDQSRLTSTSKWTIWERYHYYTCTRKKPHTSYTIFNEKGITLSTHLITDETPYNDEEHFQP